MSEKKPNTLLPEDELQAALAEIEKLSAEDSQAIPSLEMDSSEDAPPETDSPAAESVPADDAEPDAETEDTVDGDDAPEDEDVSADEDQPVDEDSTESEDVSEEPESSEEPGEDEPEAVEPEADADVEPDVDTSDDTDTRDGEQSELTFSEIEQQAVAEAEALAGSSGGANAAAVPGFGGDTPADGQDDLVAALAEVQASSAAKAKAPKETPPARKPEALESVEVEAPAAESESDVNSGRRFRFQIGKKEVVEEQPDVADYRPPEERGEAASSATELRPAAPIGKRAYRLADRWLEKLNQPFARLDSNIKAAIGMAAVTTVVVSLLAMLLMPVILPHRDAVVFLEEKVQKMNTPAAEETPPAETESADAK